MVEQLTERIQRRAPLAPLGRVTRFAPLFPLPVALVLWLLSLRHVALDRMGDLGLLQVLPVLYWVAVALLTLGFVLTLRERRLGQGWLAGYVLGLIAVVHATPTLLYPNLRYAWAWKHVAVVDAMLRHSGTVPHAGGLDIYNQWPGFFLLNAFFLKVTGLGSPLGYAAWAPPVVNALLLVPLLLLYRALSTDRMLVWGAVWVYYSTSWIGQDYFAPQAFAFLLYIGLIAMVLRRLPLRPARPDAPPGDPDPAERPTGRAPWGWKIVLVLLLEAVIVCSHQLTPLMTVSALALLALPRRNRRVVLWPLLGSVVLTAAWGATVARPYLSANLGSFVRSLAAPDGNVASGFANLGTAAPGQVVVGWVDRGLSATVLLLAVVCLVRRPWTRRTPLPLLLLSPLPLLAANGYGGEMIFRAYLFSLPYAALLVGALLRAPQRSRAHRGLWRPLGVTGLLLALLAGLFLGYDSKEAMNYFTPQEAAAAQRLIQLAPPGSVVVAVTGAVPGIDERYEQHIEVRLVDSPAETRKLVAVDPLAGLREGLGFVKVGTPAYLVLSRAQTWELRLTGVLPGDTVTRLEEAVSTTPGFTLVYRNQDASVYRFTVR